MKADAKTDEKAQPTAIPMPDGEQGFNWKRCWYPVTFVQDLPANRPYSFSLYDEPFVLFRNQDGKLACLTDRCPHRAAKLSDGQIIDGKIECLYHGWQFGGEGECLSIPQLPADAKIPTNACVESFKVVERQGIIWMWRGKTEAADEGSIPTLPDLDKPGFAHIDKITDLPYDQSYFIEHALDPAHLHFIHDGSQGNRKNAQPLEMEVIESSGQGIRGRVRETRKPNQRWISFEFIAPNLVSFKFSIEQRGWFFGQAFYLLPLGKGRCQLMSRTYRNFFTWKIKLIPRWLIHMNQNKILEEDLQLVGQQEQIERLGKNLQEVYVPLNTSDLLVIEYRKWLDKFGSSLPYYQGYSTSKDVGSGECDQKLMPLDRFSQHTQLCSSCSRAYQVTNQLKQTFVGVAIALAALAIITDGYWSQIVAVSGSLSAVALAAVFWGLRTHFARSYTRR